MREYASPTNPIYAVAFVPGDRPRLAALTEAAVYLWDPDRPEPAAVLPGKCSWGNEQPGWQYPVLAGSPDGRWLVAGPPELPLVWDLTDPAGKPAALPVPGRLLTAMFPRGDDRLLAIYRTWVREGADFVAGRFPLGTRRRKPERPTALQLPAELKAEIRFVGPGCYPASLSGDGRRLASAPATCVAYVWDVESGKWIGDIWPDDRFPFEVGISPDGSKVAVDEGNAVFVHDAVTLEVVVRWKAHEPYVSRLAWSPDGRLLARTNQRTTAWVYEVETGREVAALRAGRVGLTSVAFAPDGLTFATGTEDGRVRVWDVEAS